MDDFGVKCSDIFSIMSSLNELVHTAPMMEQKAAFEKYSEPKYVPCWILIKFCILGMAKLH